LYTEDASAARRIFEHQSKTTFATTSANFGSRGLLGSAYDGRMTSSVCVGAVLEPALKVFSPTLEFPEIAEAQQQNVRSFERQCGAIASEASSEHWPFRRRWRAAVAANRAQEQDTQRRGTSRLAISRATPAPV